MMKVFGYILKKKFMGFEAGKLVIANKEIIDKTNPQFFSQLNKKEIEVLLSLIKRSSFLGEDIESLYTLVVKLQNQYIEQSKQ